MVRFRESTVEAQAKQTITLEFIGTSEHTAEGREQLHGDHPTPIEVQPLPTARPGADSFAIASRNDPCPSEELDLEFEQPTGGALSSREEEPSVAGQSKLKVLP